jgi:hypothetical protein
LTQKSSSKQDSNSLNIVVHIGAPRTGSSAMQSILMKYRNELKKCGVCYFDKPEYIFDFESRSQDTRFDLFPGNINDISAILDDVQHREKSLTAQKDDVEIDQKIRNILNVHANAIDKNDTHLILTAENIAWLGVDIISNLISIMSSYFSASIPLAYVERIGYRMTHDDEAPHHRAVFPPVS